MKKAPLIGGMHLFVFGRFNLCIDAILEFQGILGRNYRSVIRIFPSGASIFNCTIFSYS